MLNDIDSSVWLLRIASCSRVHFLAFREYVEMIGEPRDEAI